MRKIGLPQRPDSARIEPQRAPVGFAVDGANVYWTEWGNSPGSSGVGRVAKCSVNGCNNVPTAIADGLDGPMGIAVDSTRVYWATQGAGPTDGQIHIAAK